MAWASYIMKRSDGRLTVMASRFTDLMILGHDAWQHEQRHTRFDDHDTFRSLEGKWVFFLLLFPPPWSGDLKNIQKGSEINISAVHAEKRKETRCPAEQITKMSLYIVLIVLCIQRPHLML
jgi:hypothetical protein